MDSGHEDILKFFEKSLEASTKIMQLSELNCQKDQRALYSDVHDVIDSKKLDEKVQTILSRLDQLNTITQNKYLILSQLTADNSGKFPIAVEHCHQKRVAEAFRLIGNTVKNVDQLRADWKLFHSTVLPLDELEDSLAIVTNASHKTHFYVDCVDQLGAKFDCGDS